MFSTTRRQFLAGVGGGVPALLVPQTLLLAADPEPLETATITAGDLTAVFRDNSGMPQLLSGVRSLVNLKDAPDFNAFDPESPGAAAGLNFEHIICGHKDKRNGFAPRHFKYALSVLHDGRSARLTRQRDDDPWSVSSTLTYTLQPPHYLNVDFRCVPHDRAAFGERGYAIFFFANYMNDVEQVAINFRGVEGPERAETWIAADGPAGHPNWNRGGTYRNSKAAELEYDADHNFSLNSWSYDYPRFTKPFYYGRTKQGMVYLLMFDKSWTQDDEIRFSVFKFKLPQLVRPAWDFQYVVHKLEEEKVYGYKARIVWKKFISAEDCQQEYEAWMEPAGKGR